MTQNRQPITLSLFIKILTIVGARPQYKKTATVSRAIAEHNRRVTYSSSLVTEVIIHTGQHYGQNMSGVFFKELEIPEPHLHLEVGSGLHGQQTGQMLIKKQLPEAEVCIAISDEYLSNPC